MARLTAYLALSAVLVLATGICSGNGRILQQLFPIDQAFARVCPVIPLADDVIRTFILPPKLDPSIRIRTTLVRIISGGNTNLSIAADDKGNIILAKPNCSDNRQVWFQNFTIDGVQYSEASSTFERFMLVPFDSFKDRSFRAMQMQPIPADGAYPVKLAPYDPLSEPASSMLWRHHYQIFGDGYDNIWSDKNASLALNGGNLREGTFVVADNPADMYVDRVLWRFERLFE